MCVSFLSRVIEQTTFLQFNELMGSFLNKLLCGFEKMHATWHVVFHCLQRWQIHVSNSEFIAAVLINLSKAYDCLTHNFITSNFKKSNYDL